MLLVLRTTPFPVKTSIIMAQEMGSEVVLSLRLLMTKMWKIPVRIDFDKIRKHKKQRYKLENELNTENNHLNLSASLLRLVSLRLSLIPNH